MNTIRKNVNYITEVILPVSFFLTLVILFAKQDLSHYWMALAIFLMVFGVVYILYFTIAKHTIIKSENNYLYINGTLKNGRHSFLDIKEIGLTKGYWGRIFDTSTILITDINNKVHRYIVPEIDAKDFKQFLESVKK